MCVILLKLMKNIYRRKFMKYLIISAMICLLAGCMNIDYTGRKFTPQEKVALCIHPKSANLDDLVLIGRFKVSAGTKVHPYEIEDALLEKAKEYGGDLLIIRPEGLTEDGVYLTNTQEFGTPPAHKATTAEKKMFGKSAALSGHNVTFHRRKYTALLYKKSAEVNRQLGLQ